MVQEKDSAGNLVKETRLKEGKHLVMAGTMDTLILSLFDESTQDVSFVDTFLLTYRMYLSAQELLKKISSLFEAGSIKKTAAVRVAQVVKKWVQRYWIVDFQLDNLQNGVNELWTILAPHVISSSQEDLPLVLRVTGSVSETKAKEAVTTPLFRLFFFPRSNVLSRWIFIQQKTWLEVEKLPKALRTYGDQSEDREWGFLSLSRDLENFVGILAAIEFKFYAGIRPEEFLEKLTWKGSADEKNPKTKNLFGLIDWVNQLGYWMATEICLCYHLKDRIRVLTRFIDIGKESYRVGCYNTVFALVTGLSNSSIARLGKTWQGLSKKTQADFNELEDVCNPQFNYKKYRKLEEAVNTPFIPFIGMHMRDTFFMNDGNPSKLANGLMKYVTLGLLVFIYWILIANHPLFE